MQVQEWLIEREQLLGRIKELKAENEQLREKAGVTDDTVEGRSDGQETE